MKKHYVAPMGDVVELKAYDILTESIDDNQSHKDDPFKD